MSARNPRCRDCGLHADARTVCLWGAGPKHAKVMIVGEAPGYNEDRTGKPFTGKAGEVLDKALDAAGIARDDVYITNVVKCRPPDNKTPSGKEMTACRKYLEAELESVRPKYVITLGATALKGVLRKTGINEMHGQIINLDGRKYMPTFHPAAALYDPKRLTPIREDFKRFGGEITGKKPRPPELNIRVIEDLATFKKCIEDIQRTRHVSFDSETSGLDQHAPDFEMHSFQVGTKKTQWFLPLQIDWSPFRDRTHFQREMLKKLQRAIDGCDEVSTANGKFDNIAAMCAYGLRFKVTFDVGVAAHLLDENQPIGLKYRARVDLNAPDWDIEAEKKRGRGNGTHNEDNKQEFIEYACFDVYWTRRLTKLYRKRLAATDGLMSVFRNLMIPAGRVLELAEYEGFYINRKRRKKVRTELKTKIAKIEKKLNRYADINWNSTQQVGQFLFGKLGLTPLDKTGGGADSTSESVMKRLADKHPVPKLILELRENKKLLSTYVDGWRDLMHGSQVYFSFKLSGTVTGRLASRLHGTPRNKMIRSLIDAPPGWVFWSADFSQIELRIAAMISGDIALLQAYKNGEDVHLQTACDVLGVPPDKVSYEQRKRAKAVNFGFIYGMMPPKFVKYARDDYEINISLREAKRYRNGFFNKYSMLLDWHERQRRIVRSAGEVRNPIGRIRHLPDIGSSDPSKRAEAERQAINSPVQGFASDLKLMAMIEICEYLEGKRMDLETVASGGPLKPPRYSWDECKILGEHHDALLGIVRKDKVDKYMTLVKRIMENPMMLKRFGVKIPIPIEAEIELGPWGTKQKWEPKEAA